ncbi:DUF4112 domain-containing protein [Oscillatoria sp. FACHB-1407]|uniref:DUF4112 domain-containing protein n=1 Tax=Oscillatoria sp. FACHB-1407 TaxID=2692847 RepID=UPI0016872901|nr:DUF4112 domain-containing protein [Oscillatoria sp. FACHB-1407]MBD2464295.1 DUF4112 domain-containing protein [Oscillatoria sp. FACHB-1407]
MEPHPNAQISRLHARDEQALQRVRVVGKLLDNAVPIPGTSYRVGIDPLLGLLPGGGDAVGFVLSAYIVLEALRFRLPKETIIRMGTNLLMDSVVGSVPILGDIFDVTWKANARNLALLEAHLANPRPQRAADRWFVVAVVIAILLLGLGIITVVVLLVRLLQGLLGA